MSNLRRWILTLEAKLTEEEGLIPSTPKWPAHWTEWFRRRMQAENPPGRILIDMMLILMLSDERKDSD
jgi:hypothetical protein